MLHVCVDVRDESHLVSFHVKDLVVGAQEPHSEYDASLFGSHIQYRSITIDDLEKSLERNLIYCVVNLSFNRAESAGFITPYDIVILCLITFSTVRESFANHLIERDPVL